MSFFKATHSGKELQGGLQHPNQYFTESQAILNGDDPDAADQNSKMFCLFLLVNVLTYP